MKANTEYINTGDESGRRRVGRKLDPTTVVRMGIAGRRVHPLVQWWRLIDATDSVNPRSELWDGGEPDIGSLDPPDNQRLVDLLAGHIQSPDIADFAVWEGNGFFHAGATAIYSAGRSRSRPAPGASTARELIAGPRLRHPGRDYVLLCGPLREASTLPDLLGAKPWTPSANLVWPQDHSWCIATEVDFDSTLVGCSQAAADEILACPDLESLPINPDDSLQFDADFVNS